MIRVVGIAHHPGEGEDYYRYNFRSGSEMEQLSKYLIGKEVLYKHDYVHFKSYGTVTRAEVAANGYLWVELMLRWNEDIWNALKWGDIAGLSIGTLYGYGHKPDLGMIVNKLFAFEISLTHEGARPDSYIALFTNGNETYLSNKFISATHIMTDAHPPAATQQSAAAPPATLPQEVQRVVELAKLMEKHDIQPESMKAFLESANAAKALGVNPHAVIVKASKELSKSSVEYEKAYQEDVAFLEKDGKEYLMKQGVDEDEARTALEVFKYAFKQSPHVGLIVRASKRMLQNHETAEDALAKQHLEAEVKKLRVENETLKKACPPEFRPSFDGVSMATKKEEMKSAGTDYSNFTSDQWITALAQWKHNV